MIGILTGVFEWIKRNLGPGLKAIFEGVGKIRWFVVMLASAFVALFEVGVGWFFSASVAFVDACSTIARQVGTLVDAANSASSAVTAAAGLANCVLPVQECFAYGAMLLGLWAVIFGIRGLLALYRLIPFKMS